MLGCGTSSGINWYASQLHEPAEQVRDVRQLLLGRHRGRGDEMRAQPGAQIQHAAVGLGGRDRVGEIAELHPPDVQHRHPAGQQVVDHAHQFLRTGALGPPPFRSGAVRDLEADGVESRLLGDGDELRRLEIGGHGLVDG